MSLSTGCSLTWDVMRDRRQHILCLLFGMPHRVTLTQQIFHIPGYIFLHTYPATRIVPPPRVLWSVELHQDNQARFVIPIYYVLTDQGGELSCTMEGFFLFFEFTFFKELFSGALRRSSRIYAYCLLKLKSTYPHWTYLFVCLVCLGVVLLFLVGNKWSSSTPSYISNSVNKGESICLNQSDRAYNRRGEFISGASKDQFSHRQSRHLRWHHYQ